MSERKSVTPAALPDAAASAPLLAIDATLVDHIADGIMVTHGGHITWVNEPFVTMYRFADRESAIGADIEHAYRTAWRGSESDHSGLFEQGLAILNDNAHVAGVPFEIPLPDGRWTRVSEQRSPDNEGLFVHIDITTLKRQQQQLLEAERRARDSESLLKAMLERMEQGIILMNADRIVEVCNRRAIELLGLPEKMMASRPSFDEVLAFQWSTDEFRHTSQDVQEFIKSGRILEKATSYDRKRPDGRVIEVLTVPIGNGGALRTYTDITARKKAEEQVRHVSRHDGLTSLVNRTVFLEMLEAAVEESGRTGEAFAVHYIDLDHFKPINDRFGHAVGDKVLALTADRMRRAARDVDVVARMGGDEFAVLQYGTGRAESATALANRIVQAIAEPIEVESFSSSVSGSVGIAHYPDGGTDADTLLRNADSAMYASKESGGGTVRMFGDSGETTVER